jgi:hypothetical protein
MGAIPFSLFQRRLLIPAGLQPYEKTACPEHAGKPFSLLNMFSEDCSS